MSILIVSATELEIAPFLKEKNKADVLITGVGAIPTVFRLTHKLLQTRYDLVIQAGIAGSFNSEFGLGQVAFIKEDTFADIGIEEEGKLKTLFETGFMDKNEFPYTNGWLTNNYPLPGNFDLLQAKAITVQTVTDNKTRNLISKEKFAADMESMEGAAFHYVCLQHPVHFMQIRSVSNFVGERDKTKWQIKKAIANLNEVLVNIVKEYT